MSPALTALAVGGGAGLCILGAALLFVALGRGDEGRKGAYLFATAGLFAIWLAVLWGSYWVAYDNQAPPCTEVTR